MAIKHEHVLAIVLAVMVFVVALQTIQLVGLKSSISGDNLATGSGTAAGETYDQMMQRMHGTSAASGASAPAATSGSAPRQVGGC